MTITKTLRAAAGAVLLALAPLAPAQEKVLQVPIRSDGPKTLDPVRGSTQYDDQVISNVYETLLQWKYLARPLAQEPLLLAEMPTSVINPDGTQTWRFQLKQGVRFHDDPCFPGGKGRGLVTDDVIYSWKRFADPENEYDNFRFFDGVIVGMNEFKDQQAAAVKAGKPFDYSAPVSGLKKLSDHEFEVTIAKPVYRFLYNLAQFQTAIVPREAVEKYRSQLATHPVGTGPFMVKEGDWLPGQSITLTKNPTYRKELYPSELPADPDAAAADRAAGLDKDAGKPLPLLDRIEISFYVPDPALWLDFKAGKLGYTQVPSEYMQESFVIRTKKVRQEWTDQGVTGHPVPLLDFIFRGFNMEDPVVGGYTTEKKALRQAISLAFDSQEMNERFYNGLNILYDGPIPPGLDGYPKDGIAPVSYAGPDLDEARRLLEVAGYPGGKDKNGNPLVIEYYTSNGGNQVEQTQAEQGFAEAIGVKLNPRMIDFSELDVAVKKKKAQMFGYAWGSDYPDAENNLMLFWSKAKSPGVGAFNYDRPEYDAMYEKLLVMTPGPERTRLIEEMRDLLIEDCAFFGSMARTRFWLVRPWVRNFKPTEDFNNWMKYLSVDDSRR